MATYKDVMRWVAELDVRDAIKGFDRLEREGKKSLNELGDESEEVEGRFSALPERFSGIGSKIGKGLAAGFGAIGVGALMSQALQASWDRAGGIRKITGQFRLSAQEAERYGNEAGELYADGWGTSLDEVQQAVALTAERLSDVTLDELDDIAEQILAVSETWGEDYESIIRSITQLTQNDLAGSSQEALDLIVTGFQDGANEAGDFLDTIDEYSQHWEAMGLDGEDALNQIIAGFQNGQRDADKLADAVKEFRIRAVEDTDAITEAYETLGFNADDTREKFLKGGDSAREAFLEVLTALRNVEDPIEQNRLAVELIGTQFEDLGPKAIDALLTVRGELSETTNAAANLSDTIEDTPWENLRRDAEGWLADLGDGLGELYELGSGKGFGQGLENALADLEKQTEHTAEETDYWIERLKHADEEAEHHAGTLRDDFTQAQRTVEDAIDDARRATDEKAEADRRAEEATRRHLDSIKHLRDEVGKLKREIDDEQAWLNLQNSMDDTIAKLNDGETSARDQRLAILDLKEEVLEYAESINLPDKVVTQLLAEIDAGNLAEVENLLARWGNGITLPIRPRVIQTGGGARIRIDENGNVRSVPQGAEGGIVTRPTLAMIGEAGPEAVVPLNKTPGSSPLPGGVIGGGGEIALSDATIEKLAKAMMSATGVAISGREAWERGRR